MSRFWNRVFTYIAVIGFVSCLFAIPSVTSKDTLPKEIAEEIYQVPFEYPVVDGTVHTTYYRIEDSLRDVIRGYCSNP